MKPGRPSPEKSRKLTIGFVWSFALMLAPCLTMPAQQPAAQQSPARQSQMPAADPKQQRHEQLMADTAKLLELASELKAEVDKSTKDTLSIPVVKKADEIGKLAKKVREEMKP